MKRTRIAALAVFLFMLMAKHLCAATGDLAVSFSLVPNTGFAGSLITFNVTVTNLSANAIGSVTLKDFLPAGVSLVDQTQLSGTPFALNSTSNAISNTVNSFPANGWATFGITVAGNLDVQDGTLATNSAVVSTTSTDSNTNNNSAEFTMLLRAFVYLTLTITDQISSTVAGTANAYVVTISNPGPSVALNVAVTNMLGAQLHFNGPITGHGVTTANPDGSLTYLLGDLPGGASVQYSVPVISESSIPNGAFSVVTVSVSSSTLNQGVRTVSDSDITVVEAEVGITATNPPAIAVGSPFPYTVTAFNLGPSDAQNVALVDLLPPGVALVSQNQTSGPPFLLSANGSGVYDQITSLPAGASASFQIWASINPTTAHGTILKNAVGIFTSVTDNLPGDDATSTAVKAVNLPWNQLLLTLGPTTHLQFRGNPGQSYSIQAAGQAQGPYTNLTASVMADSAGVVEGDEPWVQEPARFYRVVSP